MTRWIKAQDSVDGLKQFVTGWLAEPWKDDLLDVTEEATSELASDYQRGDMKGEFRIMSCDVQRTHFVWLVRGIDKDGTSYLIDHGYAPTFRELDEVFKNYECSAGVMDTGFGERTQECYEQIWARRSKWWACKGWKSLTQPVGIKAIDPFSGTNKSGSKKLRLLHVDVGIFGGEILKRRGKVIDGFFLYEKPDRDYIRQLNGKFIIESVSRTGELKQEWRTKAHGQDHYFDCEVYLLALSKVLGLGQVKRKKDESNGTTENKRKTKRPVQKKGKSIW
jgi:phage terminase large subunit GpA-like protein